MGPVKGLILAFRNHRKRLETGVKCQPQTTAWSPCSKSCGHGVSSRMTNNNIKCKLVTETQICETQPCIEIPQKVLFQCPACWLYIKFWLISAKEFREGVHNFVQHLKSRFLNFVPQRAGKCKGKAVHPIQMSDGGCHSLKTFQLKHCRSSSDARFCRPHRTRTPSGRLKSKSEQTLRKKVVMTGSWLWDLDFSKNSKMLLSLYGRSNMIQKLTVNLRAIQIKTIILELALWVWRIVLCFFVKPFVLWKFGSFSLNSSLILL